MKGTGEFSREQVIVDGFLKHRETGIVTRVSQSLVFVTIVFALHCWKNNSNYIVRVSSCTLDWLEEI